MSATLLVSGLVAVLAGGGAALLGRGAGRASSAAFAVLAGAGCALIAGSALPVLAGGAAWEWRLAAVVPGGAWVFGMDALSAFFLLAVALVGGAAALYGVGYMARERPRAAALAHAGVALLIVALALVVTARAVVPFLIAWEVMAVAGFLLVMFDHEQPDTRRAGLVYLVATHTATLALIALFASWAAGTNDLTFASLRAVAARPSFRSGLVLVLALLGFGLKAGVVPLHFWLPGAHAAAPSHVSALMSGLVIKMGIYGLLRVAALLGGLPEWFGWTLLALGIGSGVLGVLWALAQHDLKRLLAYHSVENIGIILIGMGTGALGAAHGVPAVAVLGYGGAILHVLNHSIFKGLLFLGAGAVVHAAGTRRIDALGGLARAMPTTAATFLIGSAAIVGLPPLNGFVSEWTIVVALLGAGSAAVPGAGALRIAVFAVAALGLIGGLALACFAKVNGVVFLGRPRSAAAAAAREPGPAMRAPLAALAAACLAIGLTPWLVVPPALASAGVITGAAAVQAAGVDHALAGVSLFAAVLAGVLLAAWFARGWLMRHRFRLTAQTWGCAYPRPTARMQYTAASFAAPVLEPFGWLAGLETERSEGAFATHPSDPAQHRLLAPAWRRMQALGDALRSYQTGRLHINLLYVFATVIVLLGYLAFRRSP
ncbi:MAG: hypothetical protein A2085_03520 [Gemmatimonadetes bacterium GWC2_71_10]|nr:MAG: hypothetical protein A2085_03520 [Gemmatimonadetes bacterium GWC2_71_10]